MCLQCHCDMGGFESQKLNSVQLLCIIHAVDWRELGKQETHICIDYCVSFLRPILLVTQRFSDVIRDNIG